MFPHPNPGYHPQHAHAHTHSGYHHLHHHHQPAGGGFAPCECHDPTMEAAALMESDGPYAHNLSMPSSRARSPPLPPPPAAVRSVVVGVAPQPAAPVAPPALPRRHGPTCVCSLACLGVIGCLLFCAVLLVEVPWVTLEGGASILQQRRAHAQQQRHQQLLRQQHAGLGPVPPVTVALGLWDEYGVITPLQLTVALSMATGVDEQHIHVEMRGNHFFDVSIAGEGSWILDSINVESGQFLNTLNRHAADDFGARMVVSRAAATEPMAAAANGTLAAPS